MRYANPEETIIDAGEGRFVPRDPANADYSAIVASGAPIEPYVAPPAPVPQEVTRFQARAALLQAGLLDQATAIIATQSTLVKMAWDEQPTWRRTSPALSAIANALGLTSDQVDELFRAAARINI